MVKTETIAIPKAIQFQDTGATRGYCHAAEKGGKCTYMTEFFNDYFHQNKFTQKTIALYTAFGKHFSMPFERYIIMPNWETISDLKPGCFPKYCHTLVGGNSNSNTYLPGPYPMPSPRP